MSVDRIHVMNANNRLIKRITASIYHDATVAWERFTLPSASATAN